MRPAQAIATTQQFHDWFSSVEASLERDQEQVYVDHLAELVAHLDTCDSVLGSLDEARGLLSEMEANYRFVDENSRSLQLACEHMLEEQRHLLEVTDAVGARLEYFRELEKATRMLNLPGEDLVLQDDFLNLLDRLDACLDYLKLNVRPSSSSSLSTSLALEPRADFAPLSCTAARLPRRRDLPHPVPAVPDEVDDAHQDVLRVDHPQARRRRAGQGAGQGTSLRLAQLSHSPRIVELTL